MQYSDKEIGDLIEGIYSGRITDHALPVGLYDAMATYFKKGLYEGFGANMQTVREIDFQLLSSLRDNIHMFSAAKTFQQVKELNGLLIGEDGKLRTQKEFEKIAMQSYDQWNKVWGKTEYQTAVGQGRSASKWAEIERYKDLLPMLRYDAVIDKNTSEICRHLDGLVAPASSKIWLKYSPLNHFDCRCILLQENDTVKETANPMLQVNKADELMQPLFKMNPGINGYVFSPEHPYFKISKDDKDFGKTNFGLPLPAKPVKL